MHLVMSRLCTAREPPQE